MNVIQIQSFGGMAPSVTPEYMQPDIAVFARNLDVRYKDLRPLLNPVEVITAVPGGTLYKFSGASTFITKTGDVNFVRGPIPNDATERTYYTGDGAPKVTDLTLSTRQLGVPKPATAPVISKVIVTSFTKDEADSARAGTPLLMANIIRNTLVWTYRGMVDADLSDLVSVSGKPWEFHLARAGTIVDGNFTLTTESDACLVDAALECFVDTTDLHVPLFVRGGTWTVNTTTLSAALTAIPTPDTTATGAMLSSEQVTKIIASVTTYLASKDKEIDALTQRIKADKLEFVDLVNNPGIVAGIVSGAVMAYYATAGCVLALDVALSSAAKHVYDAAYAVSPSTPLTVVSAKAYITSLLKNNSDGTKSLDNPGMESWIVANIQPASWDDHYGEDRTYAAAVKITGALDLEIQKLALAAVQSVSASHGTSKYAAITSALVEMQASMEYRVKEIEIISKSLIDNLEKALVKIFDAEVGGTFPAGEVPIILSRAYVETYVTDWGDESAPSIVSNIIDCDQNDTCALTLSAIPPDRNITKRRLYRSASGSSSSAFLFQGEYLSSVTTVSDTKLNDQLGESCPTFGWDEPLANLVGLVGMPNGILLGFTGDTLHACEPYAPYAWPAKYDISIEYPIVGIAVVGQTAIVTTTGIPYFVSGVDSASLTAEKLSVNQACVAKRSMVAIGGSVVFASPDGLVLIEGGNAQVITSSMLSKQDWSLYNPSSIIAAEYEGRYFAFFTRVGGYRGCLLFDFVTNSLVELSGVADAVFSDKSTDTLYTLLSNKVNNFMPISGSALLGTWRSKSFKLPAHSCLPWLHVSAAFGSVEVQIYANGVLWHTAVVTSGEPVRLPPGRHREWQIVISSTARVYNVTLASSIEELKQVI